MDGLVLLVNEMLRLMVNVLFLPVCCNENKMHGSVIESDPDICKCRFSTGLLKPIVAGMRQELKAPG